MLPIIKVIYKEQKRGSQEDASEDKDTWCQARRAGFDHLIPEICGKRREFTPSSCSLACAHTLVYVHTQIHTHIHTHEHTHRDTHTV